MAVSLVLPDRPPLVFFRSPLPPYFSLQSFPGTWPTGWEKSIWVAQIAGVVIQVANFAAESSVIDPAVVNIFVLTLNAFLTTFVKDFGSGSMVSAKTPCE